MPEDAPGDWRADVVEALRELRPGIIRFGGSTTEAFDWRNTIATLSRDGSRVAVFVVNGMLSGLKATLDLSRWAPPKRDARVWTLLDTQKAGERDVTNSFDDPERVRTVESGARVGSAKLSRTFPALSLTVLECEVGRRG